MLFKNSRIAPFSYFRCLPQQKMFICPAHFFKTSLPHGDVPEAKLLPKLLLVRNLKVIYCLDRHRRICLVGMLSDLGGRVVVYNGAIMPKPAARLCLEP